jgi:hypothetical protein
MARKKKSAQIQSGAPVPSSNAEWHEHIRSLGLASADEYREWCRRHGFKFNRRKSWREEREERRVAEQERTQTAGLEHVRELGLETVEEYQAWCRRHGFRDSLEKKERQRQKEIQLARSLQKEISPEPKKKRGPRIAVTMEHIRSLGLESVEEYRTWCLENELGDGLDKKSELLSKERALAALTLAKRQMGRSRKLIEQIGAGKVSEDQLKTILLRKIHAGFAGLGEEGREALLRLLLHVEMRSDLLSTDPGSARWGRRPGNSLVEGLIALARYHRDWLQPVQTWQATSRSQQVQFGELARHLLARYEVPVFMDSVWFREEDVEARRQQDWFRHIGSGGNIRTADVPLKMSKKMAHHFLQAPEHYTVEEALRWGQVLGQGGSRGLAAAIDNTRLGRSFEEEAFWSSVVAFLVRHPELDEERIGPIINYIYCQKYEPRELEGGEKGDPPEPHFSMKSRSLPKLLTQVERWEKMWVREEHLQPEDTGYKKRVKFAPFYHEEEDESTGRTLQWIIQELSTARSLSSEGREMNHCVATYASKLGKLSIWSLQVREGTWNQRVLTIAIDPEECVVTEVRGRFNSNPAKEFDEREQIGNGAPRPRGRLNSKDRYFMRRSYQILQIWLEREGIGYSQLGA